MEWHELAVALALVHLGSGYDNVIQTSFVNK